MGALLRWARVDLRRERRSLLILVLLVAFAAGTVMAALAGARRGATAVDRLRARTLPATAWVLPNQPGFDWDTIRAFPEVESLATVLGVPLLEVDGKPPSSIGGADIVVHGDDRLLRTIERPVVLEGRLADRARPDEVMVTPRFARTSGKSSGDTVTLRLFTARQVDAFFRDNVVPRAGGPTVGATIVGVVRSMALVEDSYEHPGFLVASAAFLDTYRDNLVGTENSAVVNAVVRLKGGETTIPAFQSRLSEATKETDISVVNLAEEARRRQGMTGFEANSLLVFALAAALVAAVLVGQSISRHAGSRVADLMVLRALGMTPGQARVAAATGPTLAAILGTAFGAIGAIVASRWFPIGNGARYEPSPGVDADTTVLVLGGVAVPSLVAVGAVGATALALRAAAAVGPLRRSTVATVAGRAGLPAPVVVGTRFALETGRGPQAVPVRSTLSSSIAGVASTLAALTFASAIGDATANAQRFGQTHQLEAFLGFDGFDFGPLESTLRVVAEDPDVVAVNNTRTSAAQVGDVTVDLFTVAPVDRPLPIVLTRGRLPDRPGEIALAPRTAQVLALGVGDSVEVSGVLGRREVTVSGFAFVPDGIFNDYATGAWVTTQTYEDLFDGFAVRTGLVALRPGADPHAVAARLRDAVGGSLDISAPMPVLELAELRQVRALPMLLALFLALSALGALGHALTTTVRRRRGNLAVLRALGMTPNQSRCVVATQATVIALVGVAAGTPLGLALGRFVWRAVAESTPVHYVAPVPWTALVLVVPVVLVAATLLAAAPARRAGRLRPSEVLRTE